MHFNLDLTIENIPVAMMAINRQNQIVYANKETCKLFGYESLLDENLNILIPMDYRDLHDSHVDKFWENPHKKALGIARDLPGLKSDGSTVIIEVGLYPLDDDVVLVLIVDVSIRQEKKVLADLEDLKLKLTKLLDLLEPKKKVKNEADVPKAEKTLTG